MSKRKIRNPIDGMFSRWGSRPDLAAEIGTKTSTVDKWAVKGRIPGEWQFWVIKALAQKGIETANPAWMTEYHGQFADRQFPKRDAGQQ